MRTDYVAHDRSYQSKRNDPDYVGWSKRDEFAEDWSLIWQPFSQRNAFPNQGKLLELGCGAGNLSICLAQAGYDVTGIDIAPTAIDWAIENATIAGVQVDFLQGDVLELAAISDAPFDIALDGCCFHCIIGDDRAHFLRTAHRILKPNGILGIKTMCNEVPRTSYWTDHFDYETRCTMQGDLATRYIGDSNDILQEIIHANFRVLEVAVLPPRNHEDLADLHVIAEKK